MATSPFEIIAGPADVYLAATGTAFPAVDATPAAAWTKLGRTEGGVTVRSTQTVELLMADQYTGAQKAIRTEEGLEIEFEMADLTLAKYAKALNDVTVVAAAGPPSTKRIRLRLGFDVTKFAFVVRGDSPYGDWNLQYEVPLVVQVESPEPSFSREDKATLKVKYTAIEDPDAATDADRFGVLRAQDA